MSRTRREDHKAEKGRSESIIGLRDRAMRLGRVEMESEATRLRTNGGWSDRRRLWSVAQCSTPAPPESDPRLVKRIKGAKEVARQKCRESRDGALDSARLEAKRQARRSSSHIQVGRGRAEACVAPLRNCCRVTRRQACAREVQKRTGARSDHCTNGTFRAARSSHTRQVADRPLSRER